MLTVLAHSKGIMNSAYESLMRSPSVPSVLRLAFSLGYNHLGPEQQLWTQAAGRVGA